MEKEMRKSRTVSFAAILVLLFSAISVMPFIVPVTTAQPDDCDIYVNTTGWWCDGGAFNPSDTPIQDAIDNAATCCGCFSCANPCTICVKDGNYDENVYIATANLVIKSENGAASTTVTAADFGDVFHVEADCVTIQGFTVTDANGAQGLGVGNVGTAGFRLGSGVGANYCNILDNHVWGNYVGIILEWGHHNMLSGNTVSDNRHGVLVYHSDDNTIERNMIVNNPEIDTGVHLTKYSDNNKIHENCFIDNVPQAVDDGDDNDWNRNYWSDYTPPGPYTIGGDAGSKDTNPLPECPLDLWEAINTKLDELIDDVNAVDMPDIIKQRLTDKLEYAKELKDNAKEEYEAGNIEAAKKKLGVAKSQVESFASMVKITRRISEANKASFLADSTEIIAKIDTLIEYIQNDC